MTNPFAAHGIAHLSPSSLRLYRDQPAAWVVRYLLRVPSEGGPAAWRGSAVETAMDHVLKGQPEHAEKTLTTVFEDKAQGEADDRTEGERKDLPLYLEQARLALKDAEVPTRSQHKVAIVLPGIEIPLIGYADWVWADHGIDLKTTKRLPSKADPSHVEQVAVYSHATGLPFSLCYVTPRKFAVYLVTPEEVGAAMARVRRGAAALRSLLARCATPADALSVFSPDMASWHWSAPMIEAANKIYDGGQR